MMNKNTKRLTAVFLAVCMLLPIAQLAYAEDPALTGTGTEEDPYVVCGADGLAALAADPAVFDGCYIVL